jgi:hypothetical protein
MYSEEQPMVKRAFAALAILLPVFAWACSDSDHVVTQPTTSTLTSFFAPLVAPQGQGVGLAAADTPSGNLTMTLNLSVDGSNNIVAALATFNGNFTGFDESGLTSAHVNSGVAGTIGPVVIDLGIGPRHAFPTRSGPMNLVVAVSPSVAAQILANPAGFYFEAETAQSPLGAVRGQFARVTAH